LNCLNNKDGIKVTRHANRNTTPLRIRNVNVHYSAVRNGKKTRGL